MPSRGETIEHRAGIVDPAANAERSTEQGEAQSFQQQNAAYEFGCEANRKQCSNLGGPAFDAEPEEEAHQD
jgi:hypothetical protein